MGPFTLDHVSPEKPTQESGAVLDQDYSEPSWKQAKQEFVATFLVRSCFEDKLYVLKLERSLQLISTNINAHHGDTNNTFKMYLI